MDRSERFGVGCLPTAESLRNASARVDTGRMLSTIALTRARRRLVNYSADTAPAEPPMKAARRTASSSSRHTWASACIAADAAAGIGVRRQPKRDIAITRMRCRTGVPANAMPRSCSAPLPCTTSSGTRARPAGPRSNRSACGARVLQWALRALASAFPARSATRSTGLRPQYHGHHACDSARKPQSHEASSNAREVTVPTKYGLRPSRRIHATSPVNGTRTPSQVW